MKKPGKRIPEELAIIHVDNIVMFPYLLMPMIVADKKLKKVIDHALNNEKILGFFLRQKDHIDNDSVGLHTTGTAVSIVKMLRNKDGSINLLLQGVARITLKEITQKDPFYKARVEAITENFEDSTRVNALRNVALELLEKIVDDDSELNKELISGLKSVNEHGRVADIIAGNVNLEVLQKQKLLEIVHVPNRLELLNSFLSELIKQMRLENRIRSNIELEMDENQRRYYLHEQLDAIRKELGEVDEVDQELDKWREKIAKANLPDYVEETAGEELERLGMMSPASSEYSVIRTYLEWVVSIPWRKYSKDRLDLIKIDQLLTKDHYGLEKPKERILEFIAVKKLKGDKPMKGPILCFVGPPGVGKTSIGHSIAKAMNREFIRFSLGGIHDESEIRGHRRTYIGAMPGKIINELKRVGTANPIFMLDEVDKIGQDFRGDPASALLEVLDPEQNNTFLDNYLNLPFDLSEVLFITTANTLDTIPAPLRDRMETIEFSSYLEAEKVEIARKYLVPKEAKNNGLSGRNIRFMKSALQEIIRYYVREAGVRSLQRRIGSVMRKVARKVAEGEKKRFVITADNVVDFLGIRNFSHEMANRKAEIGVTTGLAWTAFGGEILFCEATALPGKGKFILTGLLGEVMQESAKLAMSVVKSMYKKLDIDIKTFDTTDIHIHLPAGAVPKDGPSAGITLTTALISLFCQKRVRHDVTMTGEITLLGQVLPVGGVREKVLAAKRAGISHVILPDANRDYFEDIDENIRAGITASFVSTIDEVLEIVLL